MTRWFGLFAAVCLVCAGSLGNAGCTRSRNTVITVLAASSLTDAFSGAQPDLRRAHPHTVVRFSFAGSQVLAREVREGVAADVVVTADTDTMDDLVAAGAVRRPRIVARNGLTLVVAPGNPKHIQVPADLTRSDLKVVLADPSVPLGRYTKSFLSRLGLSVHAASLELDARSVLAKVTTGEADAAVVYVTDGRAAVGSHRAEAVAIDAKDDIAATYEAAVLARSAQPTAAATFVDEAVSGVVQHRLRQAGFTAPVGGKS